MGASVSARCCNVTTPSKDINRDFRTMTTKSNASMKNVKEFKTLYNEKGPIKKGSKFTKIVPVNDGYCEYVCQRVSKKEMPCQDNGFIYRHCQHLASLEHPHIARFIEAFDDKNHIIMVYEKANPVRLFDRIRQRGSLTEEEAAEYLRQVAMALAVSHSQGIVHGRLSPNSLVIVHEDDEEDEEDVELQLKVCCMGQGWLLRPGLLDVEATEKSLALETYALSPELASGEMPGTCARDLPRNADKSDMWALGVIFYHMLSGTVPFKVTNRKDLSSQVGCKEVRFLETMWNKLSPAAKDAVQSMLRVIPHLRISAAQLLKHPWIKIAKASFPRKRMVAVLNNIRANISESEFKRFVLRVVAEQLPRDGALVGTVEQAFRCLDRNGDGVLTVDEIIRGLRKHLDLGSDDTELERLVAGIDRDNSGSVNMEEFISVALDQQKSCSLPVLWDAFNAFDRDRGGTITFDEIDKIVKDLEGVRLGPATAEGLAIEIRRELEEVGTNGCIDFDQFVYMLVNAQPNATDVIKKDMYRVLWGCGVDCHNIRHTEPEATWDFRKAGASVSAKSVYRKKDTHQRNNPMLEPVPPG